VVLHIGARHRPGVALAAAPLRTAASLLSADPGATQRGIGARALLPRTGADRARLLTYESGEPEGGEDAERGAATGVLANSDGEAVKSCRVHAGLLQSRA
jgi:hypothetical protein